MAFDSLAILQDIVHSHEQSYETSWLNKSYLERGMPIGFKIVPRFNGMRASSVTKSKTRRKSVSRSRLRSS
jgi:hypothetical protein